MVEPHFVPRFYPKMEDKPSTEYGLGFEIQGLRLKSCLVYYERKPKTLHCSSCWAGLGLGASRGSGFRAEGFKPWGLSRGLSLRVLELCLGLSCKGSRTVWVTQKAP